MLEFSSRTGQFSMSDVAFIRLGTAQLQFPVPLFGATAGLFP